MTMTNRLACDHWVHSADFEVNLGSYRKRQSQKQNHHRPHKVRNMGVRYLNYKNWTIRTGFLANYEAKNLLNIRASNPRAHFLIRASH